MFYVPLCLIMCLRHCLTLFKHQLLGCPVGVPQVFALSICWWRAGLHSLWVWLHHGCCGSDDLPAWLAFYHLYFLKPLSPNLSGWVVVGGWWALTRSRVSNCLVSGFVLGHWEAFLLYWKPSCFFWRFSISSNNVILFLSGTAVATAQTMERNQRYRVCLSECSA